jgi:hypothetical protein
MKAKAKQPKNADELRLDAVAFDQMMRGALQVAPVKLAHAAVVKADKKRRPAKGRPTTA